MRLLGITLLVVCSGACAPVETGFVLDFAVFPTADGADVLVEVSGGPTDTVWIAFGVGPGVSPDLVERVHSVEARNTSGQRLALHPRGNAGYEVHDPGPAWKLSYSLDLKLEANDAVFYRASSRGDDYLVLVGTDAWPRFYSDPIGLARRPDDRPAGPVVGARAHFNLPELPRAWTVATTAYAEGPRSYELDEHPIGSVFALGPYRIDEPPGAAGLRLAVHPGWKLLRNEVEEITAELLRAHRERLGGAGDNRALALLNPLPPPLYPAAGLRTAGMVRGQTLVLYADRGPSVPAAAPAVREAMAVFLGHELFHLWVPSGVQVNRELSWLSEGWAMHMGRLAARDAGILDEEASERLLQAAYGRYLQIGGYRAGSLPAASMGSESQRDLLYLRGELIFRLLERQWEPKPARESFESALWSDLAAAYDGQTPLDASEVRGVLAALVDPSVVRRYVEGQAALTPSVLGLR